MNTTTMNKISKAINKDVIRITTYLISNMAGKTLLLMLLLLQILLTFWGTSLKCAPQRSLDPWHPFLTLASVFWPAHTLTGSWPTPPPDHGCALFLLYSNLQEVRSCVSLGSRRISHKAQSLAQHLARSSCFKNACWMNGKKIDWSPMLCIIGAKLCGWKCLWLDPYHQALFGGPQTPF